MLYNTGMSRKKKIAVAAVIVIALIYYAAAELTMQAALVPEFMETLDSFSDFTDKGYSEQQNTQDIVDNYSKSRQETLDWLASLDWRKLAMENDEGFTLIAAEFAQEDPSAPWVIMFHGYTGWKEELYKYAFRFYSEGYSVLVPDLRAHGESEGKYIGLGYADIPDNLKWIKWLSQTYGDPDIALYGQSMGGAAALMLGGSGQLPDNVRAIISDSAFSDPKTLFKNKLKDWTGLPDLGLIDAAGMCLKLHGQYSLSEASALNFVDDIELPVLFIHGLADVTVPPSDMDGLYEACSSEQKYRLAIEGAGHTQGADKDPDLYYETVFGFLKRYMGGSSQ